MGLIRFDPTNLSPSHLLVIFIGAREKKHTGSGVGCEFTPVYPEVMCVLHSATTQKNRNAFRIGGSAER